MYLKKTQTLGRVEPIFLGKKSFAKRDKLRLSGMIRISEREEYRPDIIVNMIPGIEDSEHMELLMDINNIKDVDELVDGKTIFYPVGPELTEFMRIFYNE